MIFTFDYELPKPLTDIITPKIAERGGLDILEGDGLGTLDFCITDTSRLVGRIISFDEHKLRITKVQYATDGQTDDGKKVSQGAVGLLTLEDLGGELAIDSVYEIFCILFIALLALMIIHLFIGWPI